MESDALRVLVIILSTVVILFLIAAIIAAIAVIKVAKKVSAQVDKAGAITDNLAQFTAGMTRLGTPVMASKILFGIARKAFSKH